MAFYDATNPRARDYVWSKVRDNYLKYGIRTWWLDACEPELVPDQPDNLRYHIGPSLEVGNAYPMLHARGFYEGMRAEGEDEIVLLCRSAWAGSQRYGALVWSGDIDSTFEDLRRQIPAGLNIGLSGIPWWTTDIGGFQGRRHHLAVRSASSSCAGSSSACSARSSGCTGSASRAPWWARSRPARPTRCGRSARPSTRSSGT